jgi:hypothetical protein
MDREVRGRAKEILAKGTEGRRYNDNGDPVCYYCGEPLDYSIEYWKRPHRDDVYPRAEGGPCDPTNWVLCCPSCNSQKGAMPPLVWLRHVDLPPELEIDCRARAYLGKLHKECKSETELLEAIGD